MIRFNFETHFTLSSKTFYKNWIKIIIKNECFKTGEINYIFCDDAYLLRINQQYLEHEEFTDIITFDYREGKTISGDIFISIERVKENAQIFGESFHDELLRVLSHGVFHLCGYKDKTKNEASKMRQKENEAIILFKQIQYNLVNNKNIKEL